MFIRILLCLEYNLNNFLPGIEPKGESYIISDSLSKLEWIFLGIVWQASLTRVRKMLNLGIREIKLWLAGISLIMFWKQVTLLGVKTNPNVLLCKAVCVVYIAFISLVFKYLTVSSLPLMSMYLQTLYNCL